MTVPTFALVDGSWADAISLLDRGLTYGDGVFRTLRLRAGEPVWWQDQLARLAQDCRRLALPPPATTAWEEDIGKLATRTPDAAVKLIVTRGSGERGYQPPPVPQVTRVAVAAPLPDYPESLLHDGVRVRLCRLRLAGQPALAGVKHLNRLENVLARMEWNDTKTREGLLLDEAGQVISGVSSNLMIIAQGVLATPRLDRCGVAGVARDRVMAAAPRLGLKVTERHLTLDEVFAAEEVWLSNSLIRLWWVASLDGRCWDPPRHYPRILPCLDD